MIKKYKIARHFLQTCSLLALAFWATTGFTKTADDLPHAVIPAPRTIEFPWMSVATWNKMHAEDVAIAEKGDIDLLFVGDSITEGWDSALWQKNFAPYKAANFGIGGDHTGNLLWRLQHGAIGQLNPKVVVLMIGVNNFGHLHEPPEQVFQGVQAVVTQIQLAFPRAKILLNGVFPFGEAANSPKRQWTKKLNASIATLGDNKKIFFKDYGSLMLQKDGSMSPEIMADFLHPTPKGYQVWAEALMPTLHEWLD